MARSYFPSRAKAVPCAASAAASGTAAPGWAARSTRLKNGMATGTMSLALCRFSTKAGGMSTQRKKKTPARLKAAGGGWQASGRKVLFQSEQELGAELEGTRALGARQLSEVAGGHRCLQTGELRVVEGVEGFRPELEPGALLNLERFEQRHVPVVASRADHGIPGRRPPLEGCRFRERRGAEPLEPGSRVGDRRDDVRPVGGVAAVAKVVGAAADAGGGSVFKHCDAGELPSAQRRLQCLGARVAEQRDPVDKARDRNLAPVKTGGTVVPTGIEGIGDIGEDFAVDNIESVRPGEGTVDRHVLPHRGPQIHLQGLVTGGRSEFRIGRAHV